MKCRCGALLGQVNSAGEPIVRTRGVVFKAESVVLVCPSCRADVPITGDFAKALTSRLRLLLPVQSAKRIL
jgi:regulator of protease activity HflC (stomatin/prohibitin superfamily)